MGMEYRPRAFSRGLTNAGECSLAELSIRALDDENKQESVSAHPHYDLLLWLLLGGGGGGGASKRGENERQNGEQ